MRNPLKRSPSTNPKPSLRERFALMKAKAAGLAAETSQGRRAMLAGSMAAALPLPALAASTPPGAREAEFLALAPDLLPLIRRVGPAQAEAGRLFDAGDTAAGEHPGWISDDTSAAEAWGVKAKATRDANGYDEAWALANTLSIALERLADPYINEPMQTLPGIMLKAALADLGEWWSESALADVSRLAAEHFGLPAPEPFFQGLVEAGVEPDDEDEGNDESDSPAS
ncbi:hypothetical protein MKK55_00710 [Methylobacterium sp. J-059]|uniref:hypothetical protein n=2 Tax=unclassified Methylobacterium TaxID=2615210 RepID=UPI001FB8D9D3|nr:hypothetical protein [Methylobacterium sp. J-059]MCJ2037489.1 hypothetical protein [Methylobacterium sp. J-059]